MKIPRKSLVFLALAAFMGLSSNAQSLSISSASPSVSENFDSMWGPDSKEVKAGAGSEVNMVLPSGWKIDLNGSSPRVVRSWDNMSQTVMFNESENLLSNNTAGTYCWGATSDKSDRAIGGLTTDAAGDNKPRGISVVAHLTNNDTKILTNLDLNYNIEKYRTGNNENGFSVRIFTSKNGTKWTEAEDLVESFDPDGSTAGAAVVPILSRNVKNANVRVHVEPGEDIYVAWNISSTSGSKCAGAQGLAIDDVEITGIFNDTDDDWVEEEEEEHIINPSGIYLRGGDNGWGTEWEFSKESDTEYVLWDKTISQNFKIGDAKWNPINLGTNGNNITMGVPYELVLGSNPADISCGGLTFPCSRIVLTIENDTYTLLLEPNTSTKGLTSVYLVGDFNKWDYSSKAGQLTLDKSDNLFKGQIGLTAGEDGLSHWMIYQRLSLAGAWGLESDATTPSDKGTLLAGETGHVASEPGMYNVTFDINTGNYTLSVLESTAQELKLSPASSILVPEIPETVKVLSLNNSLIHYNDQAKVFNDIATSMNKDATWTKHTNLGKTLQYHWEEGDGMTDTGEPGAKMMIRSDAWTHIILQEQTILPRTDFALFSNSVKQWVEYIREACPNPNAVIILPLNWALGQDWSNFTDFNNKLVENYTKVAQEYGVVICPVGIAYQNKYNKDGGDETEKSWFLPGDDRHPTLKATYLAALMEYGIIFNEDPETVTYYPNYKTEYDNVGEMSDDIAAEMRQYASDALNEYNNVVNHHSSSISFKAAVLDQYGMEIGDQEINWSVTPSTATITNGVFSTKEKGEYTITVTSGNLSATAKVNVTDAETEVPSIDFIELSENNLDYTQDFDSMGNGGDEAQIPQGWRADGQLTERTLGTYQTASTTTIRSSHGENFGSTAKNGVWNFGNSTDLSDRALGGATTDTQGGAKSINIYAAFKNTGSKAISSLDLSYDVEKYRGGSNSAGFTVQLYTSVDGRNWKSAGPEFATSFQPDAATAGADETPMETRHMTGELEINMVPGTELFLAWNISATTGTSCMSAPLLAIDDVTVNANLKPVPVFDYYIYIENCSGYEKTSLYAWSENQPSEIFGAWPGQAPIDEKVIDGVTYQVFGHNQKEGTYHLIFNNANNGSQFEDFDVEGGRDYYLRANNDNKLATSSIDTIIDSVSENGIRFNGDEISCGAATSITIFNPAGTLMKRSSGSPVSVIDLQPGLYIVVATTSNGKESLKFMKK